MNVKAKVKVFSALLLLILSSACSTVMKDNPDIPVPPNSSQGTSSSAHEKLLSSVDIQYVLGRDHYRFLAQAHGGQVIANTFHNKQVLEGGPIDQEQYPDFLKKASEFITTIQKTPSDMENCRSPFTITVKIGTDTQIAHGCRSADGGALSRLVRDGEFLLYSKN